MGYGHLKITFKLSLTLEKAHLINTYKCNFNILRLTLVTDLWLVIILEYLYLNEAALEEDENQAKKNESLIP